MGPVELRTAGNDETIACDKGKGERLSLLGDDGFVIELELHRSAERSDPSRHDGTISCIHGFE
jgi:hypothetical protein